MGESSADEPMEAHGPAEIGIKEARKIVGTLARDAGERDQLTHLLYGGERMAAIVPVEAARTRAQAEADTAAIAELETARTEVDELRAEVKHLRRELAILQDAFENLGAEADELEGELARLRSRMTENRRDYASRLEFQEQYWAGAVTGIWELMEFYCRAVGRPQDLTDSRMAVLAARHRHAREIVAGHVRARDED